MRHVPLALVLCLCVSRAFAAASPFEPPTHGPRQADVPIRGQVRDQSGAPIAGARVVAVAGDKRRLTTLTDDRGEFVFPPAAPPFTVTVRAPGFVPATATLDAAQAADVRTFALHVAAVQETVDVSGVRGYQVSAVTTAMKTATPLRDVPQAIAVIDRTLIDDQRMAGIADVVRYVPGIGIAQGEGNRDTPIFRGNSSTSDFFVDGVRDDVQYFRDLYNVERVEAFKGPNAMIFGRGGVGGVINRVSRQANWGSSRELSLQAGSWDDRRVTADFGQAIAANTAVRATGVYESSDSYRRGVGLERYGINPTVAFVLGPQTTLRAGYEYFHDGRTADRGISSFQGRPVATAPSTFFGDPDRSHATATVNVVSSTFEHRFGAGVTLRNRLNYGDYDKFYQNVFPGAVNAAGTAVSLSAYNNGTARRNLFNQLDVTLSRRTGAIHHTVAAGAEVGRQVTDNVRMTGYFTPVGPMVTSIAVPLDNPATSMAVDFRPSATDADNRSVARVAAIYAQDQIALSRRVQAVVGLRFDRFNVDVHNNRTNIDTASRDGLLSPRASLVYKPIDEVSVYGSYTLSYLPRAGEQLSSLQPTAQALDPEEFRNYEVGAKWDFVRGLSLTGAVYRLDRGNVAVTDPLDPTLLILVDAQRTSGIELGVSGNLTRAWSVAGGYAYQDGKITRSISATAQAGAVLAQLPKHSFSLWNKYEFSPAWSAGLGLVSRGDVFTSSDNTVVLAQFLRVDAAVYYALNRHLRAQINVENLFDRDYYAFAHSNTNITPGSPRAMRVSLVTKF